MNALSEQIMEYARMLDKLKSSYPEVFRHLVGLIRSILK